MIRSTPGLIHLHCGDAAAAVHRKSGLPGELRVWRDSPAVGPWAAAEEGLISLRATWWGLAPADMGDQSHLRDLARSTEPVLWFGPDPWEQACLLWVLGSLPEGPLLDVVPLELGVARMAPGALPRCFAERTLLEADTLAEARLLWHAFLRGGWGALGGASVAALPQLGPALARLAEDHPPAGPGRTRVQIQSLVDAGVRDLAGLMEGLGALEQPAHGAWYGDLFVARMVEAMGVRIG
ncbi:MAG: hypothetical protein KA743_02815 [Geothrix sp.]|uniref:DUF1835 domain-containing protein n=1 Tax=Candidatus Geothrix odensensis TaxID=2954440 RepID=A0A936F251_9BACT|nr:hypothetical protein [Candidatus Geothrix odensensis]MBK8788833.1 hypothetical protein [Holophagaceae bacterium]MBP7617416.1 hypothetical protein [Geothrix sp.]